MSELLPRKPPVEHPDTDPRVVGLDDQEATDVFAALSAEIAHSALEALYEGPMTQSELADRLDTSIQNVDYHLEKLVATGLVEVADQWYSEKGRAMDVYVPSGEPLVLVAGSRDQIDNTHHAFDSQPAERPTLGD